MNKNAKHLVKVLQRCDYRTPSVLAKQYFGDGWQKCKDFHAIRFGAFCFLYASVAGVPYFAFLPIEAKPVVTERQFDAVVAILKQTPLVAYRNKKGNGEPEEESISFDDDNFNLSLAGWLVSKGILQKKWLKRHEIYLLLTSKNPSEPSSWIVMSGDDYTLFEIYKDNYLECISLELSGFDYKNRDEMSFLYDRFEESAKLARYIYFPLSQRQEETEFSSYDLVVQFQHLVDEAITYARHHSNTVNVPVDAL